MTIKCRKKVNPLYNNYLYLLYINQVRRSSAKFYVNMLSLNTIAVVPGSYVIPSAKSITFSQFILIKTTKSFFIDGLLFGGLPHEFNLLWR